MRAARFSLAFGHAQRPAIGKVRHALAARRMVLAEDHLLLRPMGCFPFPHAPFKGSPRRHQFPFGAAPAKIMQGSMRNCVAFMPPPAWWRNPDCRLPSAISLLLSQDCASTAAILQNRSFTRKPFRQMPRQRLRSIPVELLQLL